MTSAADLKKLFAERVTLVPGKDSWLQVRLASRGLGDDEMVVLGKFLNGLLPDVDPSSTEEAVWANVDLAENVIGSNGLISVLDVLDKKRVTCKCIKLYRNKIGDEGGVRLAETVQRQQSAVEEIHLSHNMFSARSLVALSMSLAKHEAYPFMGRSRTYIPCWVRMEYNHIAKPQEVLDMLRRDGPVKICTADNRDDCGPWRCACSDREKKGVPQVHLFTITNQSRRTVLHEDSDMREEIKRWGGDVKPLARLDPSVRKAAPPTAPTIGLGPRGLPPPKAGARAMTPTASAANAPPRQSPWDLNGVGLSRSITAPPSVGRPPVEQEIEEDSPKTGGSQFGKDISGAGYVPPPPPMAPVKSADGNNSDFCFSDKEESPTREAQSDPESAAAPRQPPLASQESAAEAFIKRLQAPAEAAGNAARPADAGASPTGGGAVDNMRQAIASQWCLTVVGAVVSCPSSCLRPITPVHSSVRFVTL